MNIFKVIDEKFDLKEKIKNLSKLFLERNYFSSGKYYVSFDTFFDRFYLHFLILSYVPPRTIILINKKNVYIIKQ